MEIELSSFSLPVYITLKNLETYYEFEVTKYHGTKQTTKCIFNALSLIRCKVEYPRTEKLKISPSIQASIDEQQAFVSHSEKYIESDPHKGLKDIMPPDDLLKIINYIYLIRPDSLDLAFSFLWGINTGVRGSSSRAFCLSDLYISVGFGPESDPPCNKTLMLILRKGQTHKDKHITNRLVGVQRHRDFRMCSVFATAMLVITILCTNPTIDFFKPPGKIPFWWDIPLN